MASANGTRRKHLLTCVVIAFLVLCSFSIVNCDTNLPTTESEEERSKNEIKEYVTYPDLDNEITTATPEMQRYQKTPSPQVSTQNKKPQESTTTQAPENMGSRGSSSRRRNDHVDSVDKYLLDGILNIVDEKFSSLNTRLMTMERGVNNLQYYSVRSFRVVNTHLHAIDTILHSMNNQLTQNENQNLLLEQAVGNIKTEMSDLQSMNSGVFQAIEQNLVHFHTDMQNRITEVKQDVEQVSSNVDQLRNSARDARRNIEILQEGQSHVINNLGDIVSTSEEILQTSNSVLNLSMSIFETSEQNAYNSKKAKTVVDMTARTMFNLSRSTDEIRNGLSLVLANISSVQVARGEHDFVTEHRALKDFPFRESSDSIPCGQVLDILEEKLKSINFTVAESSTRTPKNCDQALPFDQEDFKNQSSQLLYALATVNENVFQSVTLYRHTGSLIERILSDTEHIATEQVQLREDLVAYLLNGTEELFNRSLPDFSNFVGSSWQRTGDSGYKPDEDTAIAKDKCALTKPLLEEMSQLSKNGSQLVELLTDLALSSSSTIRNSLAKLDQGVSSLNKFQEDTLNGYLVNKVEAFSRDEKNTHLKDIKNKTDLIYLLAEAIASNTGWIPFVYHRVMFVENQVNKTLNYIINIDNSVKEMLVRQKANMAIIFKPKEKAEDSETLGPDADSNMSTSSNFKPTLSTPRLETVAGVQYPNESSAFEDMLKFVYQTNQKLNRLVPALTNLVGEPGKLCQYTEVKQKETIHNKNVHNLSWSLR